MMEATSPRFLFLFLSNVLSVSGALNFVWLEERKNGRMENFERMENWENRKVLVFPHMYLVGGVETWEGGKLFCLVGEKDGKMENVVYINWLLCPCYNKITKGLISVKKWGYFCNLLPTSSFLLSFPPNKILWVRRENFLHHFLSLLFSLLIQTRENFIFHPIFLLFHPLCFHSN